MRFLKMKVFLTLLLFIISWVGLYTNIKSVSHPKIDPVYYQKIQHLSSMENLIIQYKEDCVVEYSKRNHLSKYMTNTEYSNSLVQKQKAWIEGTKNNFSYEVQYLYQEVYNGAAIRIRGYNVRYLVNDPRIERISEANQKFYLDRHISVSTLQARNAWEITDSKGEKITGKGIRIGIIDTGIDYNHPDFVDGSGKSKKIKGGRDFADGDSDFYDNGSTFKPGFVPHGTHVSGITSGNNLTNSIRKGMAPDSDLYVYKVFSNSSDGAYAKDIVAAIDQSVKDKCHAINLSLGNSYPTKSVDPGNPYYDAVYNATKAGVVVVCAAGNAGARTPSLETNTDAPGIYEPALQVAGTDDRMNVLMKVKYPDGIEKLINCPKFSYTPPVDNKLSNKEIIDCGFGLPKDFDGLELNGKIALISRGPKSGAISFKEKNLNAKKAGAAGIITYNYEDLPIKGTLLEGKDDPYAQGFLPNLTMSGINASILKNALSLGAKIEFSDKPSICLYDMSSAGPCYSGNDNIFKPEICAPGKQICSAVMSTTKDKKRVTNPYDDWDGTSMATPCVTGIVALVRQAKPKLNAYEVKALMMNSADIITNSINNLPYSFFNQGSGQVNAVAAINAPCIITPPSFMRNQAKLKERYQFTIKNTSESKITTTLSFETFGEKIETNPIEATFEENEVILGIGEEKDFSISFHINSKKSTNKKYEGVIWIQCGSNKLHVPIIIYEGNILAVDKSISNFSISEPKVNLSSPVQNMIKFQINIGSRFLITGIDPEWDDHLNCAESFKIYVLDSKKNNLGTIYHAENLFVGSYEIPWNGKDILGNSFLPNGKYFLKAEMSGLKWIIEDNKIKEEVQIPEYTEQKSFTIEGSDLPTPPLLIISSTDKIALGSEFVLEILFADAKDISQIDLRVTFSKSSTSIISYTLGEFVDKTKMIPKRDVEFNDGIFTLTAKRDPDMTKSRLRVATLRLKADSITSKTGLLSIVDLLEVTNKAGEDVRTNIDFPIIQITKSTIKYGDFNKDGKINDLDLDLLTSQNRKTYTDPDWDGRFDLNYDLLIDLTDLAIFSRYYVKE